MDPSPVKDHDVNQDYLFTLIWEIWPGANKKYDTYIVIKIQILSTDMEWNFSFDLKWTYANDLCTFNEVEYCFSGCEIVKPCPQTLSPMVDQLLGIWYVASVWELGRIWWRKIIFPGIFFKYFNISRWKTKKWCRNNAQSWI